MARLTRKDMKVFAGSATNNSVFGSLQAGNPTITNDVEQIQSLAAWKNGWNDATMTSEKLPPLEDLQTVSYVTTYQQAYLMQEGLPEWSATVTYYKGCLAKEVTLTGFKIYNSLTDNNTGNALSDTSNWKLIMDSDDLYALDSTVLHTADITGAASSIITNTLPPSTVMVANSLGNVGYPAPENQVSIDELVTLKGITTGVSIQSQLNGKQATITGAATTIAGSNLTINRALVSNASGKVAVSAVTSTELGYLDGVTSNIQTQLTGKITATISKSGNGYCKFSNGLIIQWGYHTSTGTATITLPTAFTSTNYRVCTTTYTGDNTQLYQVPVYGLTTTNFKTRASGGANSFGYFWQAIGY